MARFSFRKRNTEEEGFLGEEADLMAYDTRGGGRGMRRILTILGIGVLLVGGWYFGRQWYFGSQQLPPPPPPVVARPAPPLPQPPAPAPTAPTMEAPPAPPAPAKPPAQEEARPAPPPPPPPAIGTAKRAEAKPGEASPTPPGPAKPEPAEVPSAKAPTKAAPAAATKYSLQIGAMVMQENANTLKQKLDAGGFPASIRKGTAPVAKQVVTVGDPTAKREAEELARRLNVDGFPSELLAVGGKYTPQIGAFFTLDEAIDLARELQKKNYQSKITSKPANTVVFQVRHGRFESRAAAVKRGEDLKSKGFNFMVVRD